VEVLLKKVHFKEKNKWKKWKPLERNFKFATDFLVC
jgi:hypothetical protein